MSEETANILIAIFTVVFTFLGGSMIWIIFHNEVASYITIAGCLSGSLVAIWFFMGDYDE
jgi:hypothetical protein